MKEKQLFLLGLGLMVLAYNAPRLIFGSVQYDALEVHYSAQRYLSEELHAGRLPFWTPYIFSGFPFLADLQVGAWYPLNWPFFLVGITPLSINAELLVHTLIACGGIRACAADARKANPRRQRPECSTGSPAGSRRTASTLACSTQRPGCHGWCWSWT